MDKYYYLIAQLPLLQFGKIPDLSRELFLAEAKKWLDQVDFKQLEKIKNKQLFGFRQPFLRQYFRFESELSRELVIYRQKRKSGQDYRFQGLLTKELLEGNPLEVEKKIMFRRWQKIEELAVGFDFSPEAVFAYFLQLGILEKMAQVDREKGEKEFEKITEVSDEKIRQDNHH